jgi:hypothetical protein
MLSIAAMKSTMSSRALLSNALEFSRRTRVDPQWVIAKGRIKIAARAKKKKSGEQNLNMSL